MFIKMTIMNVYCSHPLRSLSHVQTLLVIRFVRKHKVVVLTHFTVFRELILTVFNVSSLYFCPGSLKFSNSYIHVLDALVIA